MHKHTGRLLVWAVSSTKQQLYFVGNGIKYSFDRLLFFSYGEKENY